MLRKNVLLALSSLLAVITIPVMAQCTNAACTQMNAQYQNCKYLTPALAVFKQCLCTPVFRENYSRCLDGWVCAWNGDPSTLNQPCVTLYCPGKFDGGFDAAAFCASTSVPSTLPPLTTKTTTRPTSTSRSSSTRPLTTSLSSSTRPPLTTTPSSTQRSSTSTRRSTTISSRAPTTTLRYATVPP